MRRLAGFLSGAFGGVLASARLTDAAELISYVALAAALVALAIAATALVRVNRHIVRPQAKKVDAIVDGVTELLGPPPIPPREG